MRLLIAEDDRDLNGLLTKSLKRDGYAVDSVFNGEDALEYAHATQYDVIILDVMMPKMNGFDVIKRLRALGKMTPVLFLTAKDTVDDKVHGLDLGANDYLTKPFALQELMARLRALTRNISDSNSNLLEIADLVLDIKSHRVTRSGYAIELSSKEYALLKLLMLNKGSILSRDQIENSIWNYDYEGGTNIVDVYIRYLRKKIDADYDKKLIRTVRGMGYTIRED